MSDININIRLASKAATTGLNDFGKAANGAQKNLTLFQKAAQQANRSLDSFYGNLGANLAFRAFNGIITGIGNSIQNLRDFETALVGVGKTTGLSGKALAVLGDQIEGLSKEIPVASTELLGLGQTAAQLGIEGTDNILKFTETMARLAVATDIVGEQGAIAFARIINVTGESVQNIDRLGSTIVTLGNNFAATESQILSVSNEVAKGGARFGLTASEVLGLSTAMAALGVESQVAGSTTQKVFSLVEKAIGKGGAELKKFTDVLGLNREEFISLFKTNPQKFFISLVEGLKRTQGEGKNLSTALAELGFQDLRVTKTLGPLIDRTDLLTEAVTLQTKAYNENTSLLEESEAAFNTLDGDLQKLENSWIALTNALLKAVLPAIKATVQALTGIFNLITENRDIIVAFGIASATVLTAVAVNVAFTTAAFLGLNGTLLVLEVSATRMWLALTGPVGLAIAGIAALTAAIVVLSDTNDKERLASLQAARQRRINNGLETASLDEQISKLETKIRLDTQNKEIATGNNTVLRTRIKSQADLNQELANELFLRNGLAGIVAPTGTPSVVDPRKASEAAADAQAKRDEEERLRQSNLKKLAALEEFGAQKNELELAQLENTLLLDGEKSAADELALQFKKDQLATELENKQIALAKELGEEEKFNKLKLKAEVEQAKRANALTIAQRRFAEDEDKKRLQARTELFANLTTISRLGGAKLFETTKKIQTGVAIIDGFAAIQKALAAPPGFPFNIGGVIAATAQSVANVAAIKSQSFQDGGIVAGNSFSGDNVQANVNSGEMILNREQQTQLFNLANGGGEAGQVIEVTSIVQIDETEIGRAVSRQVADGLQLGEGGV